MGAKEALDAGLIDRLGLTNEAIDQVARAERAELAASPEGAELANAYLAIRRPALRSGLLSIARELVQMEVASRQA